MFDFGPRIEAVNIEKIKNPKELFYQPLKQLFLQQNYYITSNICEYYGHQQEFFTPVPLLNESQMKMIRKDCCIDPKYTCKKVIFSKTGVEIIFEKKESASLETETIVMSQKHFQEIIKDCRTYYLARKR